MVVPVIEVVITSIGDRNSQDESTEVGKKYVELFAAGAKHLAGLVRACWGQSYKYPDTVMHFIEYENRKYHDDHKARDFKGHALDPAMSWLTDPEKTDHYLITPNTTSRSILYAPQTNVVFFWGIDEEKFSQFAPEFFTAISKSDACLGYIWGEVQSSMSDKSGHFALGKGGVMISGWKSREEHDRDVNKPRVMAAYQAVSATVKQTDTWGMQLSIIENNGHYLKWKRLFETDRSDVLVAPGNH